MVFKLSKIVSFLNVFANVSQISKAVIAIYVYASASFGFALGYNGMCWLLCYDLEFRRY